MFILSEMMPVLAILFFVLLLSLLWGVAYWQSRQRNGALLTALAESSRGRLRLTRGPSVAGFHAQFQPAPEPFTHCTISYHTASKIALTQWLSSLGGGEGRLVIYGQFGERPSQELTWVRGQTPGRASGRAPGATLWEIRRLDITNAEYATRGPNPGGLIHAFVELQTRFEPWLDCVQILAEKTPEVEIRLRTGRLNAEAIPPLVAILRNLGRAALLK
jgi:hypothetical protein